MESGVMEEGGICVLTATIKSIVALQVVLSMLVVVRGLGVSDGDFSSLGNVHGRTHAEARSIGEVVCTRVARMIDTRGNGM